MKNPFDFTISEAIALLGETRELTIAVCQIFNKQQELRAISGRELAKKIDAAKLKLLKPPKPEVLFLSEKLFLDADKG